MACDNQKSLVSGGYTVASSVVACYSVTPMMVLLPQAALKPVVSRDFIVKNSVHGTAKNEEEIYGNVSYLIFSMSFYIHIHSYNL